MSEGADKLSKRNWNPLRLGLTTIASVTAGYVAFLHKVRQRTKFFDYLIDSSKESKKPYVIKQKEALSSSPFNVANWDEIGSHGKLVVFGTVAVVHLV